MKFHDIKKTITKQFGDVFYSYSPTFIPTGIFDLDVAIGGGVPEGRLTSFWGEKSTSKTTTLLRVMNNFLHMNPTKVAIFVDLEHTLHEDWISNYIDAKVRHRLTVVNPDYGEEAIDMICGTKKVRGIMEGEDVGLIGIDSIAMMIAVTETQKSASEGAVALNVKLVNTLYKRLIPAQSRANRVEKRKLTMIVITQPTVDMNVRSFAPITKMVGGKKTGLLSMLEVRFDKGRYGPDKANIKYKVTHGFKVLKNKSGVPERKGEYTMYLLDAEGHKAGSVDEETKVFKLAKKLNVFIKDGNKIRFQKYIFANKADLEDKLTNDPALYLAIRAETLRRLVDKPMSGFVADVKAQKELELSGKDEEDDG